MQLAERSQSGAKLRFWGESVVVAPQSNERVASALQLDHCRADGHGIHASLGQPQFMRWSNAAVTVQTQQVMPRVKDWIATPVKSSIRSNAARK
jgi:hypothetical protein